MLDVVFKDINPEKATNLALYLKEMNDLVFLLTLGQGPAISKGLIQTDKESRLMFECAENNFTVKFSATSMNDKMQAAKFEVFEGEKLVVSVAHSVRVDAPIAMRLVLDASGEIWARKELEKGFQRTISHQNLDYLKGKTPTVPAPISTADVEVTQTKEREPEQAGQALESNGGDADLTELTELQELSEDITKLSQRVIQSMQEIKDTIKLLNELSYDFSRGAAPKMTALKLDEQEVENGAKIELIDADENGYQATFRKGMLGDVTEISFFLKKNGELIFSTYFSSLGNGKISASGRNAEQVLKRLKVEIAH